MKKVVSFLETKDIEKIVVEKPSLLIKSKITFPKENKFYIIYAEDLKNSEPRIEYFQEYFDNYLCEYDAKIQLSDTEWNLIHATWIEDIFNDDFLEDFYKSINGIQNKKSDNKQIEHELLDEDKIKLKEKLELIPSLYKAVSPVIFLGIDNDLRIKLKRMFTTSLRILQKYFLDENDIKTLLNIKKLLLEIKIKLNSKNLTDRISFQLLCIQEKLLMYNKSDYTLPDLRKEMIKFFLDKSIFNKVSLLYFISTPLRTEIYYYISLISRITEVVDSTFNKDRKKFYQDFFGKDKNFEVMGIGFLNGYRKITLSNIKKFIEKYGSERDLNDLYFYYFKYDEISLLVSLKYNENKILEYEREVLYKNEIVNIKELESLDVLTEEENKEKDTMFFIPDALDNNTKILLGSFYDNKVELGKTYMIGINTKQIKENIEDYKNIFLELDEGNKKFLKEANYIEKYINLTPLLLDKMDLKNPYLFIYVKILDKKNIIALNKRKNEISKLYLCEIRIKLKTEKYQYNEFFIFENDIKIIGLVKEIKTLFNL